MLGQQTNLEFDEVRITGETSPYEICIGEVPAFELRLRLQDPSSTLTLNATNTLSFFAIVTTPENTISKTITGVTTFNEGSSLESSGDETKSFSWPTTGPNLIQLLDEGATSIFFGVRIESGTFTDPNQLDADDYAASYTLNLQTLSNPPILTPTSSLGAFDPVTDAVDLCSGQSITISVTAGYTNYQMIRTVSDTGQVTQGAITTSNTFTLTDVHPGGEEFKIRVFNQDCPQDTSTYYINVVSNTTINLSANNNPSCSGENQNFTATGSGNWFEFLVLSGGVLSLQIASESNTWSSTSLLNNDVVYVRSYFSSSSVCYSEDSATIIINSITGSNSITGNQTICPDETPALLQSDEVPSADRAGATSSFVWELNNGTGWQTINGTNGATFQPPALTQTTAYKRYLKSELGTSECLSLESNIVTVTVEASPTVSISSGFSQNIICDDEPFTLTASAGGITGATYEFIINESDSQTITATSTETSVDFNPAAPYTATTTVRVIVTTPSGCSTTASLTVIENLLTPGSISGTQSVCLEGVPTQLTSVATASSTNASATISYQWQSSPNADFSSPVINIEGATGENFQPGSITQTTYYRRLDMSTIESKTCSAITNKLTIEVKEGPGGELLINGEDVAAKTICPSDVPVFTVSGGTGQSFEFRRDGAVVETNESGTYSPDDLSGIEKIDVVVYDLPLDGGNIDPEACLSLTNSITVTVLNEVNVELVTTNAINNVFCAGENVIFTVNEPIGNNFEFIINDQQIASGAINTTSTTLLSDDDEVTVIVTLPSGCTAITSITLTENGITPGSISGTQSVCLGGIPSEIISLATPTTSSGLASVTYQWQSSANADFTAPVITIDGANNVNYQPGVINETTYYRRVDISTLNGKSCSNPTNKVTVAVKNGPGGQLLIDGENLATKTICQNDIPFLSVDGGTGQSFEFRRDGTVVETNESGSYSPDNLAGIETIDVIVYDLPLDGGNLDPQACTTFTNSITITTEAQANVELVVTGAINSVFCPGDNVVFTANVDDPFVNNYQFTLNGQQIYDGASATTSSTNLSDNAVVFVTVTLANGCTAVSSVTMIENTITQAGEITGTQSICFNDQPDEIASITGATTGNASASISYQWQSSPNANFDPPVIDIAGANGENYTPDPLAETTYFRRMALSTLFGKTCSSATNAIEVEIKPDTGGQLLIDGNALSNATLCPGDLPVLSVSGIDLNNKSFEFRKNGTVVETNETGSFSPDGLTGTNRFDVLVYNLPLNGAAIDADACSSLTNSITIVMEEQVNVQMVVTGAVNNVFCPGDNVVFEVIDPVGATYAFSVNGVNQQTSTSNQYSSTLLTNTANIEVTVVSAGGCSSLASVTLVKNEIDSAGIISGTQVICYGETPDEITSVATATHSNPLANISYEWRTSLDGASYTATGATGETYQPGPLTQTTYFQRFAISELSGKICERPTATAIEVLVTDNLNGGLINPTDPQVLCFGLTVQPTTLTVSGGNTGAFIEYQWEISTTGNSGWTSINGANGASYTPPTLTSTQTFYYRRVTKANGGGDGCEEVSDIHYIQVNDIDPGSIDNNATQTYCFGTDPEPISSVSEANSSFGQINYQWEYKTETQEWADINGATNNNYDPGPLTENTWFRRSVTAELNGTQCFQSTNEILITILPELVTGEILSNRTICENTLTPDLVLNGAATGPGITYQWENSIDNENWDIIAGEVNATLTFSEVATQTIYYRVIVTSTVNNPQIPDPNQMQISLSRTSNPLAIGEDYVVYIGSGTYSFTTTGATSDTDSIGLGLANKITNDAPGISASYSAAAKLISLQPRQSQISVGMPDAPSHNLRVLSSVTGEGCVAISDAIVVNIEPSSSLVQVSGDPNSTNNLCPNDTIGINPGDRDAIVFEWGGGATSVMIENLNPAYTPSTNGGNITPRADLGVGWYEVTAPDNRVTITGTAGPTDFFTVRTQGSGCLEESINYSIIVTPQAIAPQVIMKDNNSIYNAVIYNGVTDKWYNNTICQERATIEGGPTTVPTDFYTCFVDNSFNQLYNTFEWKIEPESAGSISAQERQKAKIKITSATATITGGATYIVVVNGQQIPVVSAVDDTIDDLGQRLAAAIQPSDIVNASYDNELNLLTVIAEQTSPPAPLYTFTRINPTTAGNNAVLDVPAISVSTQQMTVNWDPNYSGTATISVRTTGCGTPSNWYNVNVDVVEETVPSIEASDLLAPIDMSDLNAEFGAILCNGSFTGVLPDCQTTNRTPSTQFFTASNAATNDYGALLWEIEGITAGNPDVPVPGVIDENTGVVNWNSGYFGEFQIKVTPVSCDAVTGTTVISTFNIAERNTDLPLIAPIGGDSVLPKCPIPAAGLVTTTLRNFDNYPVRWFVDDLSAIRTGGGDNQNTVISIASRELQADPGSDDKELTLNWQQGYSGIIVVRAIPRDCPGAERKYPIIIPGPADIQLIPGSNSNQLVCEGDPIQNISYSLKGAATGVVSQTSMNLPDGITPSRQDFVQITRIRLTENINLPITPSNRYVTTIDGLDYSYNVQNGDDLDGVGNGILNAIQGVISSTYDDNLNILTVEGAIPGQSFSIIVNRPIDPGVNFTVIDSTEVLTMITLSGNPEGEATTYNYTLTTTVPDDSCTEDSISGFITISPSSSIQLTVGNTITEICDDGDLPLIQFTVENALSADIDDAELPAGVTDSFAGGILTISGRPNINPVQPTSFDYNVVTVNNVNGCKPEASFSGRIIVNPSPIISVVDATTVNQNVCAFQEITPIEFTVNNPAFGLEFVPDETNLPDGVNGKLFARQQITQINLGGTDGAAGTINVVINNQETFTFSPTDTSTFDEAGNQLAIDIGLSANYEATYNPPVLEIRHALDGIPFLISTNKTGTNLTISEPNTIQTSTFFIISGTASETVNNPTEFSYVLRPIGPACTAQTSNISGTIIVDPSSFGVFDQTSGPEQQTVCDERAIQQIRYDIFGATQVLEGADNPDWLQFSFDNITKVLTIDGTPQIGNTLQQSFDYNYSLSGNFLCGTSTFTLSGIITVNPKDQLTLTTAAGTDSQVVCAGGDPTLSAIETITYQFGGSTIFANISETLPEGVNVAFDAVSNTLSIVGVVTADVTQTTQYDYTITTTGTCDPVTLNGSISVVPAATISLTSGITSLDQEICDNTSITSITFDLGGSAVNYTYDGFPPGLNFALNGNNAVISGQPNLNNTSPQTYTVTVSIVGSGSCQEEFLSGEITILPKDQLTHISGAKNQVICNGDDPASPSIDPIVFQIGGGADFAYVTGLPDGLIGTFTSADNRLTIDGNPTLTITQTTDFSYNVITTGACSNTTDFGQIRVNPNSYIVLTSNASTTNQVNDSGVCVGDEIVPITFTIGGQANGIDSSSIPSWLTLQNTGVSADLNEKFYRITGSPNTNDTEITVYTFTISTTGNQCGPEDSTTFSIQVNPKPTFSDLSAIAVQDISCNGLADGRIIVPENLNTFLSGGVGSNRAQVNTLTVSGTFDANDRIRILINNTITYEYVIKSLAFNNPDAEDNIAIAIGLAQQINNNIPAEVPVTADTNQNEVTLTSDQSGLPFTVDLLDGNGVQSAQNGEIINEATITNLTLDYSLIWEYRKESSSTASMITYNEIGESGFYDLTVVLTGGCTSTTETFEITEPEPLSISKPDTCGETITAQASGGTANYIYTLRNLTTNSSYEFPNALPASQPVAFNTAGRVEIGDLIRVDVRDGAGCVVPSDVVTMAGTLSITLAANTRVVHDYCNENPDVGFGSIELNYGGQLAVTGGSNNYTYAWSNPAIGYTNSTMNINNLLPGVYNLEVTDNEFARCILRESFTVLGADPLDVAPTPGNAPNAVSGVSSNTDIDEKISLNCSTSALVLEVQASGGLNSNYIYNWDRNGNNIGSGGNKLTVDPPVSGIYTVEVSIDVSSLDAPFGYDQSDLACTKIYSFEVLVPNELSVVEDTTQRIVPACPGDFAQLVFNVNGGVNGGGPYTVRFDNGLSGTSSGPSDREIIITGIDTSNHSSFSSYTVTGGDTSCSKAGNLVSQISLPNYSEIDIQATPQNIDCSVGQEGNVTFSYTGNPNLNSLSIQLKSTLLNFNYFNTWQNLSSGAGDAIIEIDQAGTYEYKIFGTPASGATSNTNVCELGSGTVEVLDEGNNQILILDVKKEDPPCGSDSGGSISLILDENTITPQMSIKWQKITAITSTVTSSGSTETTEVITQVWQYIPSLEGNLSIQNLAKGSYRAIINSNNQGSCGNNEIITNTQVVGGRGFEVLNLRYVEAPPADPNVDSCSIDNLRYNILFSLVNEKINGGNITIEVTKISSNGVGYSQIFLASNSSSDVSKITWPLTSDRSGNYAIKGVPFGDYSIRISETGSATATLCELNQILIIPELTELEYIGESSFVLDKCDREVEISAVVQGGVPFVGIDGEPFYKYNWQFVTGSGADQIIFEYSGENITVNDPGTLFLTVQDSKGCEKDVTDQVQIEILDELSPFILEPDLVVGPQSNSLTVFAEEPSCDNPNRDDGKIKFNVIGGTLNNSNVQYPYSVVWEKYDAGTSSYLEMDGSNGLSNLSNQEFANNLTPGQYRVTVEPINWTCTLNSIDSGIGTVKVITVPQNQDLVITNGPLIDVSEYNFTNGSSTICESGGSGYLYVNVFNNYDGNIEFYYSDENNPVPYQQLDNTTFKVEISESFEIADLIIKNEEGCRVSAEIDLQIGKPNFTFSSFNSQVSGNSSDTQLPIILAREEVTFTNTSTGTYSYAEWDFGDGGPVERIFSQIGTASPVTNIYGVSGTYYPRLRIYNALGCYKEESKILVVGKGYNIMVPNVFTPNNDTYNDRFTPLFSGFKSFQMTIYDYRGNLIYTEEKVIDPSTPLQSMNITGWDGDTQIDSPYYIYSIYGTTLFGNIEVQKSGTFVIIR